MEVVAAARNNNEGNLTFPSLFGFRFPFLKTIQKREKRGVTLERIDSNHPRGRFFWTIYSPPFAMWTIVISTTHYNGDGRLKPDDLGVSDVIGPFQKKAEADTTRRILSDAALTADEEEDWMEWIIEVVEISHPSTKFDNTALSRIFKDNFEPWK